MKYDGNRKRKKSQNIKVNRVKVSFGGTMSGNKKEKKIINEIKPGPHVEPVPKPGVKPTPHPEPNPRPTETNNKSA